MHLYKHKLTDNSVYTVFVCGVCVSESRSEKTKRKLFRHYTVGTYDGLEIPR